MFFFSPAILSLLSTDYVQKLWTESLRLIPSVVFARYLMGFFLLYWGKNVAAAKSASLFNGKVDYFAKVLPKVDAYSWYLTQSSSLEFALK